mmetsp:Transcript_5866/g.24664  ORF Transcript_5866/g.24664 Transcript_5866/m.24664 type:complete len:93 (+) Transcript_5866:181-459(+)
MALAVSVLGGYGQLQEVDRLCHDGINGNIPTNTSFFVEVACAYAHARNIDAGLKVLDFMSSRGARKADSTRRQELVTWGMILAAFSEFSFLR